MKVSQALQELRLWERNKQWLTGGQRLADKLSYYPHIVTSYTRMIAGTKRIKYLGKAFLFDNAASPLNLQIYPYEIKQKILNNLAKKPKRILDVGGNIGQFSSTLCYFLGENTSIDIFEPNGEVFPMLEFNLSDYKNVSLYNQGLSGDAKESKKRDMYFQPGRSSIGSMIKENAGDVAELVKTQIEVISDPSIVTKRKKYDLIKVDVEGFELEVVKALKNIQTDYLFIEVSSSSRSRNYTDSTLFNAIETALGPYELVFSNGFDGNSVAYELLMRFDRLREKKTPQIKNNKKVR
jgi:FkbM family methyltransferase